MKERTLAVSLVNYNAREGLLGLVGLFWLFYFFPTKLLNITIRNVVIDGHTQKYFSPFYRKWSLKEKFALFIYTYELLRII